MQTLRPVLAAEAASNFGSMLSRLAIPWLAALVLDATPWQMGLLLVADVLAGVVAALWLGAGIERRDKRAVMLACDGGRAALLALLALAAWAQMASMALLLIVSAAAAVLTMAFELARSAWMAQRIAHAQLVQANARLAVATSLSETAAFAAGGWLFQWWGAVVALGVDAASYLVSALCLRGLARAMPGSALPITPESAPVVEAAPVTLRSRITGAWRDATAGLVAVWQHPRLRWLGLVEVLNAMALAVASTSYMIFVSRDIGFATGLLGVVFACGGLGALAGARLAEAGERRWGAARCITLGLWLAALGAACTPLVVAPGLIGIVLLVAQQLIGDAGATLFQIHARTWRQTLVPEGLVTRVDAGLRLATELALLLGAAAGGLLAAAYGTRGALWAAAMLIALAALTSAASFGAGRAPSPTAGDRPSHARTPAPPR